MKKYLASIIVALALTALPVWAALDINCLNWINDIPGITLTERDIDDDDGTLEFEYLISSEQNYKEVVAGLQQRGWKIIRKKERFECPGMPKLLMSNDEHMLELNVDVEHDFGRTSYELQIEIN